MILHSAIEIYEEEYCNGGADDQQSQQLLMARKAKEDVYKDDFSSDDEEKLEKSKSANLENGAKSRMTSFETADLIFENSIRDNF